jgi:hypothetical protein
MIALPRARKRHRRSVHNWVMGNKPVVRSESAALITAPIAKDYIALNAEDSDSAGFELFFDCTLQAFPHLARYVGTP